MKISDVIQHLEELAPLQYQEDYDNSGLIVGDITAECSGITIGLDCTEEAIQEAVERKCNLYISHHPLIFRPLRTITPREGTGRAVMAAIRAGVTVYAIHTNLDNVPDGVNATIADRLN